MIAQCVCGTTEVKLNLDSNKAICQNEKCGKEVEISSFMKQALKSSGDVERDSDVRPPLGGLVAECQQVINGKMCGKKFSAEIDKKTKKCFCPKCKKEYKLNQMTVERLIEYKIFVGETDKINKKEEARFDDNGEEIRISQTAEIEEDNEIKNIFGETKKIAKPVNRLKEKAMAEKGLVKKTVVQRISVDSNGDKIGGNVIFHPESEEADSELVADLEGRDREIIKSKPKTAKKIVKKVKK